MEQNPEVQQACKLSPRKEKIGLEQLEKISLKVFQEIRKVPKTPSRVCTEETTCKCITVKLLKTKDNEKISKEAK